MFVLDAVVEKISSGMTQNPPPPTAVALKPTGIVMVPIVGDPDAVTWNSGPVGVHAAVLLTATAAVTLIGVPEIPGLPNPGTHVFVTDEQSHIALVRVLMVG